MPLADLSPQEFCSAPDIGRLYVGGHDGRLRMFHFRDCLVDMHTVFPVAPGGRACRRMFAQFEESKYDEIFSGQFLVRLPSPPPVDLEHCFVLGGSYNYWHFVMDQLSRISLLTAFPRAGATMPTVLLNDAPPAGFLALLHRGFELLDLPPFRVGTTPKRFLRLRDAYVPCLGPLEPRYGFLRDLARRIQAGSTAAGPERVFLRRGDVPKRRIVNEQEVGQALVRQHGFVAITPGEAPPLEQVMWMKDARILVGGHGAAMTNLLFAPKLGHVVELYAHSTQPFFRRACEKSGIAHRFVEGTIEAAGPERRPDDADYHVDVSRLLEVVEAMLRSPAADRDG